MNLCLEALRLASQDANNKVREIPRYSNKGPRVDVYLNTAGVALGSPYCMSAVYTWFLEASKNLGVSCPVVKTGYCPTGVNFFDQKGKTRKSSRDAQPGDIIFFWFENLKRYGHTGIVLQNLGNGVLKTVEANTNNDGSRDGDGVYFKTRKLRDKDLIVDMQDTTVNNPAPKVSVPVAEGFAITVDGKGQLDVRGTLINDRAYVPLKQVLDLTGGKGVHGVSFDSNVLDVKTQ